MEMPDKNEIRRQIKEHRQALDRRVEEKWNREICEKVLNLPTVRQAFCVYCYVSFRHEAGTEELIGTLLDMGKYVAVPRVTGKELEFYAVSGKQDLEEGVMGIMEPKKSCLKIRDPGAPVIVPGLAFDRKWHRIGYGGGYYDRFFEREPSHPKLAIAYGFQLFDRIPWEEHDKGMDRIITPEILKQEVLL